MLIADYIRNDLIALDFKSLLIYIIAKSNVTYNLNCKGEIKMTKKQEIYFHLLSLARAVRLPSEFDAVTCKAFGHYLKDNLDDRQYSTIYGIAYRGAFCGV